MSTRVQDLREADSFIDARALVPDDTERRIANDRLWRLSNIIEQSGICEKIGTWRDGDRASHHRGGRPAAISDHGILTVLLILAVEGRPFHVSEAADIIENRLDDEGRSMLGINQHPADGDHWYDRTWRAVHRLLDVIDPYPAPRRTISVTKAQYDKLLAERTASGADLKVGRLNWFANQIIDLTWLTLPRQVRRRWKGNICIDATPVKAFARPRTKHRERTSEPDAAWYLRTGDHRDLGDESGKKVTRSLFGYEAHIAVGTPNSDALDLPDFPLLATGIAFDKPGHNIAESAMNILASMRDRNFDPAVVVGDRAYWANSKAEKLQLPARALGWKNINDYTKDQLGIADGHGGSIQVEGAWYCPSMPQPLIDATIDRRNKAIDDNEYAQRIEQRRRYLLKAKERPDADGHQPLRCPAVGKSATVACPLRDTGTPVKIGLTTIRTPPEHPDRICTQTSVSFPPTAGAKYRQDAHYGSPNWHSQYAVARNTIEGLNGYVKVGPEQLASPERRRIRGRTAQHVLTALLVAAANIRKIRTWLDNAETVDNEPHTPGHVKKRAAARKRRASLREHLPLPPDR